VIEFGARPAIHPVALLALQRDARAAVRWVQGLVEVGGMAGGALRAQPDEHTRSRALVATLAGRGAMRPDEREPVGVFPGLPDFDSPALHGVALLAIAAKLAAVNVGVAGTALLAHVAEDTVHMARSARHPFMAAQERPVGLRIMVELRTGSDRLPGCRGVATFTGYAEWSVGVGRTSRRRRGLSGGQRRKSRRSEHQPDRGGSPSDHR